MNWNRRDFLKAALLLPAGAYLAKFQALAAPHAQMVKITAIKTLGLSDVDGCLIRIETDAGLVGYGEAGATAKTARARIENIQSVLLGQDPLAIERHFHMLTDQQHNFMPNIPTVSGIDIALWDLAGKILDEPLYRLLGGPMRAAAPIYSHGAARNILDVGECRAWAQKVREALEGFTAFKIEISSADGIGRQLPFAETLNGSDFRKLATGFQNIRTALGDDLDIAMHCHSQLDTRSAIGACKAIEPVDPMWVEDALNVPYSEGWQELRQSTRVPLLTGEKLELVRGFRPFLDNGVVDIVHPDVAYAGGITGCMKIADYAQLTRTPVALHSGAGTLIRFYASAHLAGAIQNFFKIENVLGKKRYRGGDREKMAANNEPVIRKSVMAFPEGPGLGLEINDDWLRQDLAKGETWWSS